MASRRASALAKSRAARAARRSSAIATTSAGASIFAAGDRVQTQHVHHRGRLGPDRGRAGWAQFLRRQSRVDFPRQPEHLGQSGGGVEVVGQGLVEGLAAHRHFGEQRLVALPHSGVARGPLGSRRRIGQPPENVAQAVHLLLGLGQQVLAELQRAAVMAAQEGRDKRFRAVPVEDTA